MNLAIAFSTKDRVELSRRSIEPLVAGQYGLLWSDGSATDEGKKFFEDNSKEIATAGGAFANIRGGADAAIVFNLTALLQHPAGYTHVGILENDVLLSHDWQGPVMALFERGRAEGLHVGAVSARCYEDRVLIQRDGYAVCHNLGAGMTIFTREAAELVLKHFRTGWAPDNCRVFSRLCGNDISRYWAFRNRPQRVTADWHFDAVLAAHGYASLATMNLCEMIGQDPPLEQQGLRLANEPVELLRNDKQFEEYRDKLNLIRTGRLDLGLLKEPQHVDFFSNMTVFFAHQCYALHMQTCVGWRLQWSQGFGPFAWRASSDCAQIELKLAGPCSLLVSGGKTGSKVEIKDGDLLPSTHRLEPERPDGTAQVLLLNTSNDPVWRKVVLTAVEPGVLFYGVQTREPQPVNPHWSFDWSDLPKVED